MNQLIKKALFVFSLFNAGLVSAGWAKGLNEDKDYNCFGYDNNTVGAPTTYNSKSCALQYLGYNDGSTTNTLFNLATQMKNYIDGLNAVVTHNIATDAHLKTGNLFSSLDTLTTHIIQGAATTILVADINTIKFYIDNLIALNSGTPPSTWATWNKQFIRLINVLFNITAPHDQMTSAQVVAAINLIPTFATQLAAIKTNIQTFKTFIGYNSLTDGSTKASGMQLAIMTALPDGNQHPLEDCVNMQGDLVNIIQFTNQVDIIKLNQALQSLQKNLLSLIGRNVTGLGTSLTSAKTYYNSIITTLTAIGLVNYSNLLLQ